MSSQPDTPPQIFRLKITLQYCVPPIWRLVEVAGSATLADLHRIIQAAFLWENDHLHQFLTGGVLRSSSYVRKNLSPLRGGKQMPLGEILHRKGQSLFYEYDFGDGWLHEVRLEKIVPREAGVSYPRCTNAHRGAPPEDCGGPPGYDHLLEVLADPKHEEYEDLLEWVGEGFNPEDPNLPLVEKEMKKLRRVKRQRKAGPTTAEGRLQSEEWE